MCKILIAALHSSCFISLKFYFTINSFQQFCKILLKKLFSVNKKKKTNSRSCCLVAFWYNNSNYLNKYSMQSKYTNNHFSCIDENNFLHIDHRGQSVSLLFHLDIYLFAPLFYKLLLCFYHTIPNYSHHQVDHIHHNPNML